MQCSSDATGIGKKCYCTEYSKIWLNGQQILQVLLRTKWAYYNRIESKEIWRLLETNEKLSEINNFKILNMLYAMKWL